MFNDREVYCDKCGGITSVSEIHYINGWRVCESCFEMGRTTPESQRSTDKKEPIEQMGRIRFAWGYHAGAAQSNWGERRKVSETPREGCICRASDPAYFEGYIRGCEDYDNGAYHANSNAAWSQFVNSGNTAGIL